MNRLVRCVSGTAVALALTAGAQAADLKVGLSVSLSGPNSSLGIPYAKGMQAAVAYRPEINGRKVQLIVLDDALRSDQRRAQRAQAGRGREGRRADGLVGRAGHDRHLAGRPREQDADGRACRRSRCRRPKANGPSRSRSRRS